MSSNSQLRQLFDEACRTDFATFFARCMLELEPGNPYSENWHIHVMADRLMRLGDGEFRRLAINVPPRSMKTIMTSIAFAAWTLAHDPDARIIAVTYSAEVAKEHALLFNRIVTSDWFVRAFPHLQAPKHNRLMDWHTDIGGYRFATSVGGSILSRSADLIIIDDPNKGQEIYSKAARDKVKFAYDNVISTRLVHPGQSKIVLIMQRLHADDLTGHVLDQEDWHHLVIPAVAEKRERWVTAAAGEFVRRKGELLQPSRMGLSELETRKRISGQTNFLAQYQQQPIPEDGIVVRRQWLRYYEEAPEEFDYKLASWDTASSLAEDADWTVGTVWGLAGSDIYLLDVIRNKFEVPDLRKTIEDVHRINRLDATIIEDADFGRAIAQDLRRTSSHCMPILCRPHIEKLARMQGRSSMFETGKVLLPNQAPWLSTYLEELLGFPNHRNDDQVDSTSQALEWFQMRCSGLLYPERQMPDTPRLPRAVRPQGRVRSRR